MMKEHAAYGQVYLVRNVVTLQGYVGQTVSTLRNRWRQHKQSGSPCRLLSEAIKEWGPDSFEMMRLDLATSADDLNGKEKAWIHKLGTLAPNGYNLFEGGDQPSWIRAHKSIGRKRFLTERASKGFAKGPSTLTAGDVRVIFQRYDAGDSVRGIAATFGVVSSTISHILRGDTWTHLGLHTTRVRHHRITTEEVRQIVCLNQSGLLHKAIAQQSGRSRSTVSKILNAKIHTGVRSEWGLKRSNRKSAAEYQEQILKLRAQGLSYEAIGESLKISTSTAWRVCRKAGVP
jgi:transposase